MDWIKTEIWPAVQPILRETDVSEYPYSISGGTIFLSVYQGRAIAITARHVLFPLTSICLFADDRSQKIIPLEDVFYLPLEINEEYADFAIIEIDMRKLVKDSEFSLAKFIDIEKVSVDWAQNLASADFWVFGYPLEHSKIELSKEAITTARYLLRGKYRGVSEHSAFVHTIEISQNNGVTDYNGFSGGPVFAFIPNVSKPKKVFLCGIAIRGSSKSGLMHFLDLEVIISGIQAKPAPYIIERKKKA